MGDSELMMTIDEQIAFCEEKSKNIKLKTEPQTFIDITETLKRYRKKEQAIGLTGDGVPIEHIKCPICGKMYDALDSYICYCSYCGQRLQ